MMYPLLFLLCVGFVCSFEQCPLQHDSIIGQDGLDVKTVNSVDECCKFCNDHPHCVAFTFSQSDGKCSLKDNTRSTVEDAIGYVSGLKHPDLDVQPPSDEMVKEDSNDFVKPVVTAVIAVVLVVVAFKVLSQKQLEIEERKQKKEEELRDERRLRALQLQIQQQQITQQLQQEVEEMDHKMPRTEATTTTSSSISSTTDIKKLRESLLSIAAEELLQQQQQQQQRKKQSEPKISPITWEHRFYYKLLSFSNAAEYQKKLESLNLNKHAATTEPVQIAEKTFAILLASIVGDKKHGKERILYLFDIWAQTQEKFQSVKEEEKKKTCEAASMTIVDKSSQVITLHASDVVTFLIETVHNTSKHRETTFIKRSLEALPQDHPCIPSIFLQLCDKSKPASILNSDNISCTYLISCVFGGKLISSCIASAVCTTPAEPNNPQNKEFEGKITGQSIEYLSPLSSLFSAGCLPWDDPSLATYLTQENDGEEESSRQTVKVESMRSSLRLTNERRCAIIKSLISCSEKDSCLNWLAAIAETSLGRDGLGQLGMVENVVAASHSASDSFLLGVSIAALNLCLPIADDPDRISKIEPEYALGVGGTRISFDEESRLGCSEEIVEREKKSCAAEKRLKKKGYHVMTELLYIACRLVYFGPLVAFDRYFQWLDEKPLPLMEELEPSQFAHHNQLKQAERAAAEAQLLDPMLLDSLVNMAELLSQVLLDFNSRSLSLSSSSSLHLRMQPEMLVNSVVKILYTTCKVSNTQWSITCHPPFLSIELFGLLVGRKDLVYNPHLRARMCDVLRLLLPINDASSCCCPQVFQRGNISTSIAESMLVLYVDIHAAGGFEDLLHSKYVTRSVIAQCLNVLFQLLPARIAIQTKAEQGELTSFTNASLDDLISCLEQSQSLVMQQATYDHMPIEELQKNFQSLMTNVLEMMEMFTKSKSIAASYCSSEIVDKTVSVLGDKMSFAAAVILHPLSRDTMSLVSVGWNFTQILHYLTKIFNNLSLNSQFCAAVAKEDHWFSNGRFCTIIEALNASFFPKEELEKFITTSKNIKTMAESYIMQQQQCMDTEIPEQFLDAVMKTLMDDPVQLPSGNVVNRNVIARHLLNSNTDPFTRQPMTINDIVELPELQQQCVQFAKSNSKK